MLCRPPLTTCSTPQTRKEMAGSRGYAAATPGVPLWSPLAPLLPPNELRLLDSSSSDVGLDVAIVRASSAEVALAEARLEDSMAAAAAAAVNNLHAFADAPAPEFAPADTMGSGIAASGVLEGMLASGESAACAVERNASHCFTAVQPAQLGIAKDQASTESAPCSGSAEGLGPAPSGNGLSNTVSDAVQMVEGITACTGQLLETSAPDDMTAGNPGAEINAARRGQNSSVNPVLEASQASERSAVQIPDDSETPRSVCTGVAAAEADACFSEDPLRSPGDTAARVKDGAKSNLSLPLPKLIHEGSALAEQAAMQLHSIDASALDLARNARSIASKAAAAPLSVDHPLVRQAALELSRRAGIEKATLQVHREPLPDIQYLHCLGQPHQHLDQRAMHPDNMRRLHMCLASPIPTAVHSIWPFGEGTCVRKESRLAWCSAPQCQDAWPKIGLLKKNVVVQLKAMERQCSVGERIRVIKRAQLASALAALDEQGRQAASDLAAARSAMQAALEHP